jgi:hypothetical protein
MSLRIRYQNPNALALGYSIERFADGLLYDFSDGTFKPTPTTLIASLPADSGNFVGRYKVTLSPTPSAQFTDGDYCVTIHNTAAANAVVAQLGSSMHAGDDATVFPSASGVDPLSLAVPGGYAVGTAGYVLGTNIDAKVSSRLPAVSYVAPPSDYQQRGQAVVLPTAAPAWYTATAPAPTVSQIVAGVWDESRATHITPGSFGVYLDAPMSSRLPASSYVAPPTDYQQRGQTVVLPTTAPSWYSAPTPSPTVPQIVAGVWDEPRAGHVVSGSFGTCLDASVSSRLAGSGDSPGTATLLARLTATRASYLDALNINGLVASHADAAAIQNNTLVRIFAPDIVQRPSSGSVTRIIHLYTYNEQGNMATPDAAPSLSVANGAGTSRIANLDAATMSFVSTGHYQSVYTLHTSDPTEQLVWSFTVVQGGLTRQYGGTTEVVDVISVDFNANDRANLNAVLALAGTTGVLIDPSSRSGFALSQGEHASITADTVAALNSVIPASPAAGSVFARLDAPISSRSTYAGGPVASVVAPVVVGQNNDKAGYILAAAGLDSVIVEAGINARQALAPILAATAGVVTGAGSGTITIKGGNVATTRIMAATDDLGNRSAVILTLPT